jgi:hypothetical protein
MRFFVCEKGKKKSHDRSIVGQWYVVCVFALFYIQW